MPWEELDHTADWSIRVWGEDFSELLAEAGRGMYRLLNLELDENSDVTREIEIDGIDRETKLVAYLDELLYCLGSKREAYDSFDVDVEGEEVRAHLKGHKVRDQAKEIKAVTFHGLEVIETDEGFEATVVFDV